MPLAIVLILLLSAGVASAATRWAGPTDTGAGDCTSSANRCDLQQAMNAAACGDTITVVNGTYTGTYTNATNPNTCTSGNRMTLQAENLHQAIFDGDNTCGSGVTFTVADPWWIIHGLLLQQRFRFFSIEATATGTEIRHTIMKDTIHQPIVVSSADGPDNVRIHNNVFAFSDRLCDTTKTVGVIHAIQQDNLDIVNNAFIGIGKGFGEIFRTDGNQFRNHLPWFIGPAQTSSMSGGLLQGNLVFGGMSGARTYAGGRYSGISGLSIKDNIFTLMFGVFVDDCSDDSFTITNNIFYRLFQSFLTKGQDDGTKGHHVWRHNLFYCTELSMECFATVVSNNTAIVFDGTQECPSSTAGGYKANNTFQDNVLYSPVNQVGGVPALLAVEGDGDSPPAFAVKGHNLLFAEGTTYAQANNKSPGYLLHATDLYQRPVFTDPANGDFELAPTSPKYQAGSVGGVSPGIAYCEPTCGEGTGANYLRQSVMKHVMDARVFTNQLSGSAINTTFSGLVAGRDYLIYVYMPDSRPTGQHQIAIDGTHRFSYDYYQAYFNWGAPGGPQRWFVAYRHRATSTTMTLSWPSAGYFGAIRLYELPTAETAYTWMQETTAIDTTPPNPPTFLGVVCGALACTLTWTKPTTNVGGGSYTDIGGYRVRWCSNVGCTPATLLLDLGDVSTTDHTGLQAGVTYGYQVQAFDVNGNPSLWSNIAYDATDAPSGDPLVMQLLLTETSGTAANDTSTAGANDGTVNGTPVWDTPGLLFNGTTNYIRVGNAASLRPAAVTVMAFVTRTGTQQRFARLVDKTWNNGSGPSVSSYALFLNRSGADSTVLTCRAGEEYYDSPSGTIPETELHVACVYDPAASAPQLRAYAGGNFVEPGGTSTVAIPYNTDAPGGAGDLIIGLELAGTRYFTGMLRDVRVYNRALSQQEIATIAQGAQGTSGVFAQETWCWKRIDDPETTSCTANEPGSMVQGNAGRVRTTISRTVDASASTEFELYCRTPATSGTWFRVEHDCLTNPLCYGFDRRLTWDLPTTPQLTVSGKTPTSGGKFYKRASTTLEQIAIPAAQFIEREHALLARADQTIGTTFGCCERAFGAEIEDCKSGDYANEAIMTIVGPGAYIR